MHGHDKKARDHHLQEAINRRLNALYWRMAIIAVLAVAVVSVYGFVVAVAATH